MEKTTVCPMSQTAGIENVSCPTFISLNTKLVEVASGFIPADSTRHNSNNVG